MMISQIKEIETTFEVETIEAHGFKVWPFIRTYVCDKIYNEKSQAITSETSTLIKVLKNIFYGFCSVFKKHEYIIFSESGQRRLVDGLWFDKSADNIAALLNDSVIAELPSPQHFPINKVATKNIFSKAILYVLVELYARLFIRKNIFIRDESVLISLLKENNITLDYRLYIRRGIAQYKLMNRWIKWKKPRAFFVVCSYTNSGYIKACNDSHIPVTELQHGVVNKNHYAYNIFKNVDSNFYPDYFLSYGESELKVFDNGNYFIKHENVYPVGHSYLDHIRLKKIEDIGFEQLKKSYKTTVAFTSENLFEFKSIPFLIEAARLAPDVLIVIIPRNNPLENYRKYNLPHNIIFLTRWNAYETIKLCQFHATVCSTCALEAPLLGRMNVLLDIDIRTREYYENILSDRRITEFATTPKEWVEKIKSMKIIPAAECSVSVKKIFRLGYDENLKNALSKILK